MAAGKPGPAPTPSNVVAFRGNPGKRKRAEEPKPTPLVDIDPPAWLELSSDAEKVWRYLAPRCSKMGTLTEADVVAFAELCEEWAIARAARRSLRKGKGYSLITRDRTHGGEPRRHPGSMLARQHADAFRQWCARFGLTPSDRVGLPSPDDGDEDDDLFE